MLHGFLFHHSHNDKLHLTQFEYFYLELNYYADHLGQNLGQLECTYLFGLGQVINAFIEGVIIQELPGIWYTKTANTVQYTRTTYSLSCNTEVHKQYEYLQNKTRQVGAEPIIMHAGSCNNQDIHIRTHYTCRTVLWIIQTTWWHLKLHMWATCGTCTCTTMDAHSM